MMWTCIKRHRVCVQFVPPPGVHLHNIFPFFLLDPQTMLASMVMKMLIKLLNLHWTHTSLPITTIFCNCVDFDIIRQNSIQLPVSNICSIGLIFILNEWFLLCTPLALKNFNLSLAWYSRYLLSQNAVKPWQTKPQLWELPVSSDWKCAACTFELRSDAF